LTVTFFKVACGGEVFWRSSVWFLRT